MVTSLLPLTLSAGAGPVFGGGVVGIDQRTERELDADLEPYLSGQGTIKLPLKQPVPWDLVDRAIAARVAERVPQIRR